MKKVLIGLILVSGLMFGQNIGQGVGTVTVPLNSPPPTGVQQTFITNTGVTGQTTYCYFVVAVFNIGMAQNGPPTCTTISNSTLSGGNFNTVIWNPPPGATPIGYWVIRSTNTLFPGSGTVAVNATILANTTFTLNDQANALNAFTYNPASWASANIRIDDSNYGVPIITVTNNVGNVPDIRWPMVAILPPTTTQSKGVYHIVAGTVTVAALNTGISILPAIKGVQYELAGILFSPVGGQPATCTAVTLNSSIAPWQVLVSVPVATLTSGSWVNETGANIVFNNFLAPLGVGDGVTLTQAGSTCTTMTSLTYRVAYLMGDRI